MHQLLHPLAGTLMGTEVEVEVEVDAEVEAVEIIALPTNTNDKENRRLRFAALPSFIFSLCCRNRIERWNVALHRSPVYQDNAHTHVGTPLSAASYDHFLRVFCRIAVIFYG